MINTKKILEKFLQNYRFKMVKPYLKGDVLDFGGNEGELRPFVKGKYLVINYDHSPLKDQKFDTIVSLAVIEHIEVEEVYIIFNKLANALKTGGIIFLTTPTPMNKPILEMLAASRLLDKQNIEEHKHYWSKKEIFKLAEKNGLKVKKYKKFQLGFNQMAVLSK